MKKNPNLNKIKRPIFIAFESELYPLTHNYICYLNGTADWMMPNLDDTDWNTYFNFNTRSPTEFFNDAESMIKNWPNLILHWEYL